MKPFADILSSEILRLKSPPKHISIDEYLSELNTSMGFGEHLRILKDDLVEVKDSFLPDLLKTASNGVLGRFAKKNPKERFVICNNEEDFVHHHTSKTILGLEFLNGGDIGLHLKDRLQHISDHTTNVILASYINSSAR